MSHRPRINARFPGYLFVVPAEAPKHLARMYAADSIVSNARFDELSIHSLKVLPETIAKEAGLEWSSLDQRR